MEELKIEWVDTSKHIKDAVEFLDLYFNEEHKDDKTAILAYLTLRACAQTFVNVGDRMADDGR